MSEERPVEPTPEAPPGETPPEVPPAGEPRPEPEPAPPQSGYYGAVFSSTARTKASCWGYRFSLEGVLPQLAGRTSLDEEADRL
jgi:hypothetical protein